MTMCASMWRRTSFLFLNSVIRSIRECLVQYGIASVVHIPVRKADFKAVVHSYEIQGSPGFIVDRCKDNKKSCKRIKTECV